MNHKELYRQKLISVDDALELINDNDNIVSALASAEPRTLLQRIHEISQRINSINITTCLPMGIYPYYSDIEYSDKIQMDGWFYSGAIRKATGNGNISFVPNHLHLAGTKRLHHRKPNLFVGSASPMDKHGYISLSLSATYERTMLKNSDKVIIEINDKRPRTFGDTIIHISEIDYVYEDNYDIPELTIQEPTEKDLIIGRYIADHIENGSTLQLGIGGIPNAVAYMLKDKKNLGIHTEMLTDGMVDLVKSGAVNGKEKSLYPEKIIATFALGSKKLYDFIDDNPAVLIKDGCWVNNPYVIGQNNKMVSINTTIEIDLTGQCCSESIGHRQFSGTGGQSDTAVGAQISEGGKSFIALYSTAFVREEGTDTKKMISKITPMLKQGAAVSLSRNDVDYVVTEYGIASLRGTSVKERAELLINIAHPDFRVSLKEEARQMGIL